MRSARVHIVALATTLCVVPALAQAQHRYKWRDGGGQTHYSDVLSRDAMQLGYEIVNKDGLIIKRVNRPLTTDERAAADRQAVKTKAAKDAVDAGIRNDRQMLAAFPTESDLLTTQRLTLRQLDQSLRAGREGLKTQEANLADLLARADDLQHRDVKVSPQLTKQIADLRSQLEQQRGFLDRKQRDRDATAASQLDQLTHYRDLKTGREAQL
ncbi:MAG: DUF4124 domain-containing protein [Dokdonella sp.]